MITLITKIIEIILTIINVFKKSPQQKSNEALGELEKSLKDKNTDEVSKWFGKRL